MSLCDGISKMISNIPGLHNTDVHKQAVNISNKFKLLFLKFSKVHNLINSGKYFNESDIAELGKTIFFITENKS